MSLKESLKNNATDSLLVQKLKKEDQLDIPQEDEFFNLLHDKIMQSVEKTEIKPLSRWAKTWVFLETKYKVQHWPYRLAKVGLVSVSLGVAALLVAVAVKIYQRVFDVQTLSNQALIMAEAQKNPTKWSELVTNYQNESDFYAEVLSQRQDVGTIVEINKLVSESL